MLELSLELRCNLQTRTATTTVDTVTEEKLNAFIAEQAVNGWVVECWAAKESLPFDEGVLEARAGKPMEANPYAEHYWKHNEWLMGWGFAHENN